MFWKTLVALVSFGAHVLILHASSSDGSNGLEILFSAVKDIRLMTVGMTNYTPVLGGLESVRFIDYDYEDQWLFYTSLEPQSNHAVLKRIKIGADAGSAELVIGSNAIAVEDITVDWVGKNIYFIDGELNHVEVCRYNGSHRRVVIAKGLNQPKGIAVLPSKGYLFVADYGDEPKIMRYNMDGSGFLLLLLKSANTFPGSITVDVVTNMLFWGDLAADAVHMLSIDGKNDVIVYRGSKAFYMAACDGSLFWTDSTKIFSMDTRNLSSLIGPVVVVGNKPNSVEPQGLVVFSRKAQVPAKSACQQKNGGCSHLCLSEPSSGYVCACPTGIALLNDNKTCDTGMQQFLLVARKQDIRAMSLQIDQLIPFVLPLSGLLGVSGVDYDPVDRMVYWTDVVTKSINRAFMDGTGQETVVAYDVEHPDQIAVDWVSRNLYWTDLKLARIEVARLDGSTRKIIISDRLDKPRGIVVDPADGKIYWTDWGNKSQIECADVDGENREVLVSENIKWPNGIALDYQTRSLYWVDAKQNTVERLNLKDKTRSEIHNDVGHPFGLAILGDYAYWTDQLHRKVQRLSLIKNSKERLKDILEGVGDVMGIKAVDSELVYGVSVACRKNNDNCSHFCFHKSSVGAVCSCPTRMELTSDGKTCRVPSGFLLYSVSSAIKKISIDSMKSSLELPFGRLVDISNLDMFYRDSLVFWLSDTQPPAIMRAFLNGSGQAVVAQSGFEDVTGLAVDWMAGNVYWISNNPDKIEVARLNGGYRRTLLYGLDAVSPVHIAVNPHTRKIYWFSGRIDSSLLSLREANLDGSGIRTITEFAASPLSMAIDFDYNMIYCTLQMGGKPTIFSWNPLTRASKTVAPGGNNPKGLVVFKDNLFYAENEGISNQPMIMVLSKNGKVRQQLLEKNGFIMDVKVFHGELQTGSNVCSKDNGGCEQLCFATSSTSRRCACATQYSLRQDGLTCQAPAEFLLFNDASTVYLKLFDQSLTEAALPVPDAPHVSSLDYDVVLDHIFWLSSDLKRIGHSRQDGTEIHTVNLPRESSPVDFAVEPFSGGIFLTDSISNTIDFYRIANSSLNGTIFSGASFEPKFHPRQIVAYPELGRLFWTNAGYGDVLSTIESINLAGTDRRTVFVCRSQRSSLVDLAIDCEGNRLYWIDEGTFRIESSTVEGSDWKVHIVLGEKEMPVSLAIHSNHLYWADQQTLMIMKAATSTVNNNCTLYQGKHKSLRSVVAVNTTRSNIRHPCMVNNGGCSHICMAEGALGYAPGGGDLKPKCACPLQQTPVDGKECRLFTCKASEFKCTVDSTCIPGALVCDMKPDCSDGQDENQNCGHLRPPCKDLHMCGSYCIPSSLLCDGKRDCFDGSDEKDSLCSCPDDGFRCSPGFCISAGKVCDDYQDCEGGYDEALPVCNKTLPTKLTSVGAQRRSRVITGIISGVIICIVIFMFVLLLWFKFRNMKKNAAKAIGHNGGVTWQLKKLPGFAASSVSDASAEHSQSLDTYVSGGESHCSELSYYDRNHVTGASSSSAVSGYTHTPMNPPPSPMTERAMSTISEASTVLNGDNRLPRACEHCMQQIIEQVPVDAANGFVRHSAPPPTPASTTVADATDLYYPIREPRASSDKFCKSCRSVSSQRTRKNRPGATWLSTARARPNVAFLAGNSASYFPNDLNDCSEYEPLHGEWQDSEDPTANYDTSAFTEFHLHFAPPPTPCTNYMSEVTYASDDDDERPPSPTNTEQSVGMPLRSFYAPPPSPTSQLM